MPKRSKSGNPPQRLRAQARRTIAGRRKQARLVADDIANRAQRRLEEAGVRVDLRDPDPDLITMTAAAEKVGVKYDTLWTHVKRGWLKTIPVDAGGKRLFLIRIDDLRRWRDSQIERLSKIETEKSAERVAALKRVAI